MERNKSDCDNLIFYLPTYIILKNINKKKKATEKYLFELKIGRLI